MAIKPMKIEFTMDGTGVFMWPKQPVHLDGLLAWALMPFEKIKAPPGPNEEPFELKIPLGTWKIDGQTGWCASALFPDGNFFESTQYYRKKFRSEKGNMIKGSVTIAGGRYAERNSPMPLIACRKLVAYAVGSAKRVRHILKKQIHHIGSMSSAGKGKVLGVEVVNIEDDFSMVKEGRAMRFLPNDEGLRFGRVRPPYHNNFESVKTCYPGEPYTRKLPDWREER